VEDGDDPFVRGGHLMHEPERVQDVGCAAFVQSALVGLRGDDEGAFERGHGVPFAGYEIGISLF
jgi:hypothetical protein